MATRYAGEIAVNHCAPDAQRSELLDAPSTSDEPITRYPHIHCWHTDQLFSKHAFMRGGYTREDIEDRDVSIIKHYCLAMSFLSREELAPSPGPPDAGRVPGEFLLASSRSNGAADKEK